MCRPAGGSVEEWPDREEHGAACQGRGRQQEEGEVHNLFRDRGDHKVRGQAICLSTIVITYRSQQHQADILQKSSAVVAALLAGPRQQAVEGYAGEAADPGEGEGQLEDRGHYLLGWS